ncbi:hypothetical protein BUALT_Bualt03G0000800 [Buddleja alternifolia]|uniref:Uncharacterized protein n=1 Tax=Buddleja alternifolia TaxID=168488 RepID=A0AAV6XWP4_9LAMI|nr:hypothetical protein BUALT_Bualt03G0000800 [Buddleja alternifolia]
MMFSVDQRSRGSVEVQIWAACLPWFRNGEGSRRRLSAVATGARFRIIIMNNNNNNAGPKSPSPVTTTNGDDAFGDWESDRTTFNGPTSYRSRDSDATERERLRVSDIIRKLKVGCESPPPRVKTTSSPDQSEQRCFPLWLRLVHHASGAARHIMICSCRWSVIGKTNFKDLEHVRPFPNLSPRPHSETAKFLHNIEINTHTKDEEASKQQEVTGTNYELTDYCTDKGDYSNNETYLVSDVSHTEVGWEELQSDYDEQQEEVGSNREWIDEVSRPRSDWEGLRQARYQEMLDPFSDNQEIRSLLARFTNLLYL